VTPSTPKLFLSFSFLFFSPQVLFNFIFLYFLHHIKLHIYVTFITGTLLVLKPEFKKQFSQYRRLFPGVKPPDCKAAHTSSSNTKVKKVWSYKSTPPCAFKQCTRTNLPLHFWYR
jgi:hypothetical protein